MAGLSHIPQPLEGPLVSVEQKLVRQVKCPNPECDQLLDITDITAGTKIQCASCENITWTPKHHLRWWQKIQGFLITNLASLALGVLGSLIASHLYDGFNVGPSEATPASLSPKTDESERQSN